MSSMANEKKHNKIYLKKKKQGFFFFPSNWGAQGFKFRWIQWLKGYSGRLLVPVLRVVLFAGSGGDKMAAFQVQSRIGD